MAAEKILISDTLDSGFRTKYNNTVDTLINGNAVVVDNIIKLPKFDGTFWLIDITAEFATNNDVSTLINPAIRQATELITGQVRKATTAEILDGSTDFGYVSAMGLKYALDNFNLIADNYIVGENLFENGLVKLSSVGNTEIGISVVNGSAVETDYIKLIDGGWQATGFLSINSDTNAYTAKISSDNLTSNINYVLPNYQVSGVNVLNDWNYLINKPTTIAGYGITDYNSLFDTRFASKIAATVTFGSNIVVEGFRTNQNAFFYANTIFYGNIFDKNNSTGTSGKMLTPASGGGVEWTLIDWSIITNKPTTFTPSAHTLDSHSNVVITSVDNNQLLKYNSATGKWENWTNNFITGNQSITLGGDVTGSGTTSITTAIANTVVSAKILTGLNVTGGSISSADSILTAFGKLQNQLNSLSGAVIYQGVWNASTNSPSLTSSVGTKGYYYIVNVAGSTSLNAITDWKIGDWAIFDGTTWNKVDNTDSVSSVNGFTGAISLTTDNITEGATNLYWTNARGDARYPQLSGSYSNPSWINTLDWSKLINKPTTFTPSTHTHTIGEVTELSATLAGKQALSADLTAIDALSGTTGFLKKTATDTWALDTTAYLSANQNIAISGDASGSGTTAITLTLATVVTAGTYRSVTVDVKGRVTAGTNPTTIAGYGITDFFEQTLGGTFTPNNTAIIGTDNIRQIAEKTQGQLNVKQAKLDLYSGYDEGLYNAVIVSDGGFFNWKVLNSTAISDFSASVLSQVLTGYTAGSNTALTSSNTVLTAFRNLQAQITANNTLIGTSISGTVSFLPKFTSANGIGNSTISDDGATITVGDAAFLQDIIGGRKISLNYPVHFGNNRIYDNTGGDGYNVMVIDTQELQIDATDVNVIGRLGISENYLTITKKQPVAYGAINAYIDALYSELYITSSKTNIIGSLGVSVIEGITGASVTANDLWNFTTLPQVTTDATLANQLVRYSQVQSLVSAGFSVSTACKLAFITDQSLSGAKTQGGYTTVTGDNMLLTGQSTTSANGVYVYDGTNWARNTANDTDTEIRGKGHLILNGTYANTQWVNNNSSTITVGSTSITYVQWSGAELDPVFTAHAAFGVTTTKISNWDTAFANYANRNSTVTVSTSARLTVNSGGSQSSAISTNPNFALDLATTGVSNGTYVKVNVDVYGRVTSGQTAIVISDVTALQGQLDAKQATTASLTAILALNTNGFIKRTGTDTYAIDTASYLPLTGGPLSGALQLNYSVRIGSNNSDNGNLYFGKSTMSSLSTGMFNTGIGTSAASGLTTGQNNTFLGYSAGSSITTGSSNIIIGAGNTGITTGSNNVIIGRSVSGLSSSLSNNIIIADGAGNRRINVGSTGLVGFGLTSPAYRVDVSGDVNVTGVYRLNGSFGADHTFLKSNGTTQEWSLLTVGEISDIASTYLSISSAATNYALKADAVLYGTYDGERGFKLYHDAGKTNSAALFFANQDTGVIGIHAYGLSGTTVTEYGIQIDSDGKVYHKKVDGTRARFLTTDDNIGSNGGGAWTGGRVSSDIKVGSGLSIYFGSYIGIDQPNESQYSGKIAGGFQSSKVFSSIVSGMLVEAGTVGSHLWLGALGNMYLKATKYFLGDVEIDMSTFGINKYLRATSSTKAEWVV